MQQFQITLKNEKVRFYKQLSWLIIIINVLFFAYLSLFTENREERIGSIALLLLLAIAFGLKLYSRNSKWQLGFHPFFFLLILAWLQKENYWFAIAVFIFGILNTLAERKLVVIYYTSSIVYPSLPKKKIKWGDLNNTTIKDGLLTIDFKNNKLIQQPIDESKTSVIEKEFNEFCRQQLKTSNQ